MLVFETGGKTREPGGEKTLGARMRTFDKPKPHITSNSGIEPGVHFSKLLKTFQVRKVILCAGFLPTEIQLSFVLKAK